MGNLTSLQLVFGALGQLQKSPRASSLCCSCCYSPLDHSKLNFTLAVLEEMVVGWYMYAALQTTMLLYKESQ